MANRKSEPATTRNMRLVVGYLDGPGAPDALAGLLARHREPGPDWLSWEALAVLLRDITGELYTRESIRSWATRYGIPLDTSNVFDGTNEVARYRRLLSKAGVSTE